MGIWMIPLNYGDWG